MNLNGVAKFGGSSVADASCMRRCANIIKCNGNYKIIVVSATAKTTNQLEEVGALASFKKSEAIEVFIHKVFGRHEQLAKDLEVNFVVKKQLEHLKEEVLGIIDRYCAELEVKLMDQLYSIGERLSSLIFSSFLSIYLKKVYKVSLLDARDIIITDAHFSCANPKIPNIKNAFDSLEDNSHEIFVTSGFIGKTLSGETTTLGREGSDFSATLFAEAMEAKFVHIWTDVPGIATIDPRKSKNAIFMDHLSYEAATLLAESGAKVLFHRTLGPAVRGEIVVMVKSSKDYDKQGTIIDSRVDLEQPFFGVASLKKDLFSIVSIIGNDLKNIITSWNLHLENTIPSFKLLKIEKKIAIFHVSSENADDFEIILHDRMLSLNKT